MFADIKFIREHPDALKKAVEDKNEPLDVDGLLSLDRRLVSLRRRMEALRAEKNALGKKVARASPNERQDLVEEGRRIGEAIASLKPEAESAEADFLEMCYLVPAIAHPDAPVGRDAGGNVEVLKRGSPPVFGFDPLDHVQLLAANGWAEFEKTAQVCGSRSYSLRDDMVLLEAALHRFALEKLQSKGFTLASLPSLVRQQALLGTGHFPAGGDQVYHLPEDDLYLSGTAEVQINSLHAGEILDEKRLPLLYAGHSPCFRREAGSHGKDVRGLIRVHQFQKVEQYVLCKNDPAESEKWHKALLDISLEIVSQLDLPHRVVECCTGDMGTGKVRMFDVECWVPSEGAYRETHSCSSLYDWQARRTNLRYRGADGTVRFCHTLNNTALATPRILVSFLECHQRRDASVSLPGVLRPLMGGRQYLGGAHGKE